MKKLIQYLFYALLFFSCSNNETAEKLESLYKADNFFEFNRVLDRAKEQLPYYEWIYFEALSLNLLNRPEGSNRLIEQLTMKHADKFPDSMLVQIYHIKASNHLRLYEYQDAYQTLNFILSRYSSILKQPQLEDFRDDSSLLSLISGYRKQIVYIPGDTHIPITIDKAGLMNIPLCGSDTTRYPFIFDTGANLSTISESMAKKFNLTVFDGYIRGYAIGGEDQTGVGICPVLQISGITVRNAVFLILPDSSMYFKQLDYRINGIIGFPVINAFRQIALTTNDLFVYEQEASSDHHNFLLEDLQPVIEIEYNNNQIPCYFDSGARKTRMFMAFYERFKNDPSLSCKDTIVNVGGGAGYHRFRVKRVDSLSLKTADKFFSLKNINIHTSDSILHGSANIYGNIGQDFIQNYKTMIINFDKMFIDFK